MEQNHKEKRARNYVPLYLSIVLVLGILIGAYLIPVQVKTITSSSTMSTKIGEVMQLINRYYFDKVDVDELNDQAIQAILQNLDPHSSYITKKNSKQYDEMLFGEFDGIGIQFNVLNDTVLVVSVIPEGPSHKVGLMPGDKIIAVDNKTIAGVQIKNEDVIKKLRGKKGTMVKVSILRSGMKERMDFNIKRDKIPLESVNVSYMIDQEIGYILIDNFSTTTGDEFIQALKQLKEQNMQKLIVDLRGNPGGFLGAAIDICDQFLPKGKLIVYTQGLHVGKEEYKASNRGLFQDDNQSLAILIDEWSASASEIVAGAVQDHDRGIVIGRRSFGKGLVQRQFYLKDSSEVMLTVARYFTPSGRCIQKPFDNKSTEDYFVDILDRYENGELENADSIRFIDSLKYKTAKGRTVYGGGGIMPDWFIPLQTSDSIVYFNKLSNQGVVFTYAMEYVDKNRKTLQKYKSVEQFDKQFTVSNAMVQEIVRKGEEKGLPAKDVTAYSKQEIKKWTKAYIARNLFNTTGFYQIINKEDE
ncbi:MAG: S41 family peptidase, partial [Bacteroidales bacterium]|nr:S41 family peptidase [Bacteroidales bacterium]MDD3692144.1 S41 family peptidase [Bacteroidales bacterium]MDD4045400.1 S41 family peptidase [Bacteroidales bacterium]